MSKLPEYYPKDSLVHSLNVKVDSKLMMLIQKTSLDFGFEYYREYVKALLNAHGQGLVVLKSDFDDENLILALQMKQTHIDSLETELQNMVKKNKELEDEIIEIQSKSNRNLIGIQSESDLEPTDNKEVIGIRLESEQSDSDTVTQSSNTVDDVVKQPMVIALDSDIQPMVMTDSDVPDGIPKESFRNYVRRLEDDRVKLESALKICHEMFTERQKKGDANIQLFQAEMAIYSLVEYIRIYFHQFFPPNRVKETLFISVRKSYPNFPTTKDPYPQP